MLHSNNHLVLRGKILGIEISLRFQIMGPG